jgi:putative transposase
MRLKVPKLGQPTFETAIIERYRRRESSVEKALIEMYLAGVSVRRVEDITEALRGTRVSPSTQKDLWDNRGVAQPTDRGRTPVCLPRRRLLKRSWAGEVRNVSLLVAIGVNSDGYQEIIGICEGTKEDKARLGLSQAPQGTRSHRPPADYLRCLHRACRERKSGGANAVAVQVRSARLALRK